MSHPSQLRGGIFDGDKDDIGVWPDEIWAYTCIHDPPCKAAHGVHWGHNQDPATLELARATAREAGVDLEVYGRDCLEGETMIYTWQQMLDRENDQDRELVPAGHEPTAMTPWPSGIALDESVGVR